MASPTNTVDSLIRALTEAAAQLQAMGFAETRLIGSLAGARQVLQTAAAKGLDAVGDPDVAQRRHDLRELITAIAGWVPMRAPGVETATQARAVAVIERNVATLIELLRQLPGVRSGAT